MNRTLLAAGETTVIGLGASILALAHAPGLSPAAQPCGWQQGGMQPLPRDLSAADVQHMMAHRLAWQGRPNLKVGTVEERDDDTIVGEIVTQDGSLVQRLEIDRHTGWMRPAQ